MTNVRRVRGAVGVGFTIAVVTVMSGCGSASESFTDRLAEEVIERASGGSVEVDRDGDRLVISGEDGEAVIESDGESFTIESEDGTAQFSTNADVPAEWTAVLEVFPGADVVGVFEYTEGDIKSQKVSMVIDDSFEQVVEFYDRSLTAAGFTEGSRMAQSSGGNAFAQAIFTRDELTVTMLASENDGKVDLSISLTG
jgi:hypothetical protein